MATEILERVTLPDGQELCLARWDIHVGLKIGPRTLMSTQHHDSEDVLGEIVAAQLASVAKPHVLIGGLGLGFTLRAALDKLPPQAKVTVAELVPAVARWNRGEHGVHSGRPLADPRVKLIVDDVARVIAGRTKFDAIVLDVDNGPVAMTDRRNARLYMRAGLKRARAALRPGGLLAVWSAFPSRAFTRWLREVGFTVTIARPEPDIPGGPRFYIWLARRA